VGLKHVLAPLQAGEPDSAEVKTLVKKQSLAFGQVECAAFSFRSVARIGNLQGVTKFVKLQLDNNHLQRIDNMERLVSGGCMGYACCSSNVQV
jgi:hypothetical protein